MLPEVLVLAHDAPRYLECLRELADGGVRLTAAEDAADALTRYAGEPVLLAAPELAAAVLRKHHGVRWVQSTWAGVRPLLELGRRDFLVTGVKGVFGPQMAEFVFAHLLARELRVVERMERQRRREWWHGRSGTLRGKTLAVLGTGSIGAHLAHTGRSFGLRCLGFNRDGRSIEPFERVFPASALHALLAASDYVVAVLPDTRATTGLLDAAALRAMKPTAILVNAGRGNLIDEAALAAALAAGELAGAVLDVFHTEPLPAGSPLWTAPNLVITAHVAGFSPPKEVSAIFAANYRRYTAGQPLDHVIDFERGY